MVRATPTQGRPRRWSTDQLPASISTAAARQGYSSRSSFQIRMDAGAPSADSSIVDRVATGVDVTADNTTHRQVSRANSQRRSLAVKKRFTAARGALMSHRRPFLVDAVA